MCHLQSPPGGAACATAAVEATGVLSCTFKRAPSFLCRLVWWCTCCTVVTRQVGARRKAVTVNSALEFRHIFCHSKDTALWRRGCSSGIVAASIAQLGVLSYKYSRCVSSTLFRMLDRAIPPGLQNTGSDSGHPPQSFRVTCNDMYVFRISLMV